MTQQELEAKYNGRQLDENRLDGNFKMMGKFGKVFVYTFAFNTADYTISAEICVEMGNVIGVTFEKELRDDGWGINPDAGPSEMQPEEYDTAAQYMDSVVI